MSIYCAKFNFRSWISKFLGRSDQNSMAFQVKLEQDYTPVGHPISSVRTIQYNKYRLLRTFRDPLWLASLPFRRVMFRIAKNWNGSRVRWTRLHQNSCHCSNAHFRMAMKILYQIQNQIFPYRGKRQKHLIPNWLQLK